MPFQNLFDVEFKPICEVDAKICEDNVIDKVVNMRVIS